MVGRIAEFLFYQWDANDVYCFEPFLDFRRLALTFRVVRFQLDTGEWETLVTSLPRTEFPLMALKDLYHLRWGIENAFRELKYDIGLNNFPAKREDFIIQEIFAKLFMYNVAQRIIIDVVVVKSRGKYAV
ncbi:MAG: transposase, partial [Spirochaetales bacterium]|nr:transposase [Spirochaetales bacterium]